MNGNMTLDTAATAPGNKLPVNKRRVGLWVASGSRFATRGPVAARKLPRTACPARNGKPAPVFEGICRATAGARGAFLERRGRRCRLAAGYTLA